MTTEFGFCLESDLELPVVLKQRSVLLYSVIHYGMFLYVVNVNVFALLKVENIVKVEADPSLPAAHLV